MTSAGLKEVFQLQREIDALLAQPHISKEQRKRADLLMSRVASLRDMGMSTDEANRALVAEYGREIHPLSEEQRVHEDLFRAYLRGEHIEERATTFIAGQQSILYTSGQNGGFLVPTSFRQEAAEGMAAIDPLLNPNVVTLIQEPDYSLRPTSLPGWDLSGVLAEIVSETGTYEQNSVPSITSKMLNGFTYRAAFDASLEWDEDEKAYGSPMAAMARATGIALGRAIGKDLINGNGTTAPSGLLTGAADSGVTTANAGKVVLQDFTDVFYSINKIYRDSEKCAWLVTDAVHKMIAECVDDQHRPIFPVVNGVTYVLGRPVYVAPSLPAYNSSLGTQAPGSFCLFGDFSHYYVHASSIMLRRLLQVPGLIENGKCRYLSLQRVDAIYHDPTDGSLPAVVAARLHS